MSTTQSLRGTLAGRVFRSKLYRRVALDGPVPSELRRPFPWHAPGDRTQADAIVGNEFMFFGRRVPFGAMPWSVLPPGAVLAATMHGFAWLADLKAMGSDVARLRARALVIGWILTHRRWSAPAWSPSVLGERLASWLTAADFVLDGASGDERARFMEALGHQARHLTRVIGETSGSEDAFAALRGEIACALCLDAAVPLRPCLDRLDREIGRQIAADGGHIGRNPASAAARFPGAGGHSRGSGRRAGTGAAELAECDRTDGADAAGIASWRWPAGSFPGRQGIRQGADRLGACGKPGWRGCTAQRTRYWHTNAWPQAEPSSLSTSALRPSAVTPRLSRSR